MKIFISVPTSTATWFWNMNNLLSNSLKDCGHQMTDFTNSELVRKITLIYYSKIYNSALSLQNIPLMFPIDISTIF